MSNPYSISFGIEPAILISRDAEIKTIVNTFNSDTPSSTTFIYTGIRGSGKTVTMSVLLDKLKDDKHWIIAVLNQNRDLLSALAANLFEDPFLKPLFIKADISLNLGLNVGLEEKGPADDVEVQLKKMLKVIKKTGRKVLIAIDEAVNNKNFRIFASSYQMFLIERFPVFLIMTGLYKNIYSLQNEKTLTFLYRAPKYELGPLNMIAVSNSFKDTLSVTEEEADSLAGLTNGYPYAFQVLGYLMYENREKSVSEILPQYDEILWEYSYSKIWSELSRREKEVVSAIINSNDTKMSAKDIKSITGLTDSSFPTYRRRLGEGGVLSINEYGYCELALPRFKEIIRRIF